MACLLRGYTPGFLACLFFLCVLSESQSQTSDVEQFNQNGFLAVRSQFRRAQANGVRRLLDAWWEQRPASPALWLEATLPENYGSFNRSRMKLTEAPVRVRSRPYRLYVPLLLPEFYHIVYNPSLLARLNKLVGSTSSCMFNPTRGLFFERGTQQELHDDTWYSLAHESTPGHMIAVWFAFDDVDADNGPLTYIAGSHLRKEDEDAFSPLESKRRQRFTIPESTPREVKAAFANKVVRSATASGGRQTFFHARAGDVGIWHERLLHGGGRIKNLSRTRRSLAVHYQCFGNDPQPST